MVVKNMFKQICVEGKGKICPNCTLPKFTTFSFFALNNNWRNKAAMFVCFVFKEKKLFHSIYAWHRRVKHFQNLQLIRSVLIMIKCISIKITFYTLESKSCPYKCSSFANVSIILTHKHHIWESTESINHLQINCSVR